MLAKYAVGYLATGIAFALIDSIWLRTMYTRLYQPELGPLLGSLKLGPAVVFYLLYIAGMMWFAVAPALANGRWQTMASKVSEQYMHAAIRLASSKNNITVEYC